MTEQEVVWLAESPLAMIEGEQIAFSVEWQGAALVTDPEASVFKNGVDITADSMDAGDDHIINGNVLTLKKMRARTTDGGARYVVVVEANVDGNVERRKLLIHIVRASAEE